MSADIVSLSKTRKAKARARKEQQASENRLIFGRTKAEKALAAAARKHAEKHVEGHRLEPPSVLPLKPYGTIRRD